MRLLRRQSFGRSPRREGPPSRRVRGRYFQHSPSVRILRHGRPGVAASSRRLPARSRVNLLNCAFETIAAILGWVSVWKLAHQKTVVGVFAPSFVFSALWAICAVPYYVVHADLLSASACSFRALALLSWSFMWIHFSQKVPGKKPNLRLVQMKKPSPACSTSSPRHDP